MNIPNGFWIGMQKANPKSYSGLPWVLLNPVETYLFGARDDQPWEVRRWWLRAHVSAHFFGTSDDPYFTTFLTVSPVGDKLTTDFAKTLIDAEGLGQDNVTDFLAVSYSAMDYIGHIFGPSSLESEDGLLQLDRTLADLFSHVDARIGLENTLIVLSADHGAPEAPGYLKEYRVESRVSLCPTAGTHSRPLPVSKKLSASKDKLIGDYSHPYLYLSDEALATPGVDVYALEKMVAEEISAFDGVALAVTAEDVERGTLPDTMVMRAVRNNHHPLRSGNIMLVNEPGYFIADLDGLTVAVTHGTPWNYDTFVPIIFAGFGLEPTEGRHDGYRLSILPKLLPQWPEQ